MRWLVLSTCFLFGLVGQASGDGPAADNWPKTVEDLATALRDSDPGALLPVLSDDASINMFDSKNGDAVRLLARTRKGNLIGTFNFVHAPEAMASDIAEIMKTAEVPEELKHRMGMHDAAHARRANRTAVTWLSEALGAKAGDKIGVLIFWCDKPAAGDPELIFILVKGDPEAQFTKVKTICFGNPMPRPNK